MLHGSPDLFVCETVTADQLADFRVRVAVLAVQVQDAGEVARITDIHRIGDGRNGGTRRVNPRVQVFQEHVVAVVGSHKTFDRQPHPMCKQTSCDIAEVSKRDIEADDYYVRGDFIGKQGVERSYEKQLRGEKGVEILLRDARGRIQGRYMDGKYDKTPVPGKNLTLGIDVELQMLGERLLEGKIGSIVAIEPETGEILCMVSSPTFDPRLMVGRQRGKNHLDLARDSWKPLLNRAIMGQFPPGSTFKTSQALTFLEEGIIVPETPYSCYHGFVHAGLRVGCHAHGSPLALVPAIATSCNAYFCWGLYHMIGAKKKYGSVQNAMSTWRDYMVSMGFGYPLGVDLPGEKRGMIPNAEYYDKNYRGSWNGLTIISIAIGQGEVTLTPLHCQFGSDNSQSWLLCYSPCGKRSGR